jgi:hypothetical protein
LGDSGDPLPDPTGIRRWPPVNRYIVLIYRSVTSVYWQRRLIITRSRL